MKLGVWAKAGQKKSQMYLYDQIGKSYDGEGITANSVKEALAEMPKGSELDVYINSPGGSVFDGIAIYNQLQRWEGKKTVYIDGIAASIASVIAMAGDEVKMAENGMFMIHRAWTVAIGNANEMRRMAESMDKIDSTIIGTYAKKSKGDPKKIEEWMDAETWMTADEAVERGFVDSTTGEKAVKAQFDLLEKFNNVPKELLARSRDLDAKMARMDMRVARFQKK